MKTTLFLFMISLNFSILFESCQNCDPVTIEYTESESYIDYEEQEVTLTYNLTDQYLKWQRNPGSVLTGRTPSITVSCNIENTSDYDGEFNLFAKVGSFVGEETIVNGSTFVKAHSFGTITANTSIGHYTFEDVEIGDYQITPQTIKVQNEITKYRDVLKTRPCNPCEDDCGNTN